MKIIDYFFAFLASSATRATEVLVAAVLNFMRTI